MPNRVHIISHPRSGNGKGTIILKEVMQILDGFQLEYINYQTNYATHANLLTKEMIHSSGDRTIDYLLVIGGDGTLHEVVDTLQESKRNIPITYIPAGTGNDFHRTWYPKAGPREIIEGMLFNRQVQDIPIFLFENHLSNRQGTVINSYGLGLDALINARAKANLASVSPSVAKLYHRFNLAYLKAIVESLNTIPHFCLEYTMDGTTYLVDDASMVLVMNTPYIGGGIRLDNRTQPRAHELSLVIYHDITSDAVRDIIPRVFKSHDYQSSPYINQISGQHLRLKVAHDSVLSQVDGETIQQGPIDLSFRLGSQSFYFPKK